MSSTIKPEEDVKERKHADDNPENQAADDDLPVDEEKEKEKEKEELKDPGCDRDENAMPSHQKEEELIKKYGGILPKKKPLISKDHEHAFFDSADWALGKQESQKPKGQLEALRPKLQPSPHNQLRSRRSVYAPTDESDGDGGNLSSEEEISTADGDNNKKEKEENTRG